MTDATLSHPAPASNRGAIAGGIVLAVLAAALAVLPLTMTLSAYVLNMLMQAVTYTVAVLGLTVVLGYTGQLSLAQAAFFGIGAYAVALGTVDYGLGFWLSMVLGLAASAVAGAVLGLTSLRIGGHYLAMVTIAFQQIVTLVLVNSIDVTHGPDGVSGIARPNLPGVSLANAKAYLTFCIVVLYAVGLAVWYLRRTRLGRAMQAVRDNELAAGVVGVNTYRTKVVAFTISAILGGLGGALFASGFSYISPDQFSFAESVVFLTMALIGGVQSAFGTALGTGLLILLPEWLRFLKEIYLAIYGLSVILIMVFMPEGIWGLLERIAHVGGGRPAVVTPRPFRLDIPDSGPADILETRGLAKHFGGLRAVDGVDLKVERGSVHALIGPNGSGKTTLLNVLSGLYRPTGGSVSLAGRDITRLAPHERCAAGVGRTFQNIRLFRSLSILDNVLIGAQRPGAPAKGEAALRERAFEALGFVGLADKASELVGSLPYGHQRLVEIARALAGNPTLLLLDEPAAGLNPTEKQELVELLRRLKGHGLTIFLIDHDMAMVERIADHITVLNFGKRIAEGTPRDVLRHPAVIAAYLGEVPTHGAA
ncbi:branched-chain amino acid ABC transporter [Skermanella aerolata]|uniref:Branched-chain amino acid ABC transporter n=1 Tax=Skermanella aerolata TaxID=393310 RepID=A0A512DIS1_9PROT|nr:branched-chain amino acid ABC transporter ATP-binding protein/permease [Skermanella aerolata]KJB97427.1 ABC transporter [Skermanella aerolata KACC 11604]GEO36374.1 branched-chain amino acid ABC transporter [Skermanella aerolata]